MYNTLITILQVQKSSTVTTAITKFVIAYSFSLNLSTTVDKSKIGKHIQ